MHHIRCNKKKFTHRLTFGVRMNKKKHQQQRITNTHNEEQQNDEQE